VAIDDVFLRAGFRMGGHKGIRRMMLRYKKWCAVTVLACGLLIPIVASAIIPLLVGATYYFAADAAMVNALIFSSILVGSVIAFVGMDVSPGAPIANSSLNVQIKYNAPAPAPTGWTQATQAEADAGFPNPVPPTNSPTQSGWYHMKGGSVAAIASIAVPPASGVGLPNPAMDAICAVQSPGSTHGTNNEFPNNTGRLIKFVCQNAGVTISEPIYIYSAGVKKPLDGKCNVVQFMKDMLDPDCLDVEDRVIADGGRVSVRDVGGKVAGLRVFYDNQSQLNIVSEDRSATGLLTYESVVIGEDPGDGTAPVIGKGSGQGRGPGFMDGVDAPAAGPPGGGGAGTPASGGTCGGANQPACPGAGGAVCGAAPLPPCQVDLGGQGTAPGDPLAVTPSEIAQVLQMPILSEFKTFNLPGHASECPRPTFTAFDRMYTFDAHCALLDAHTAALRAAMLLVFGISAIFIVLRA
jgi:hypothetical protein